MRLELSGDTFTAFVNGRYIGQYQTGDLLEGSSGLALASSTLALRSFPMHCAGVCRRFPISMLLPKFSKLHPNTGSGVGFGGKVITEPDRADPGDPLVSVNYAIVRDRIGARQPA